MENYDGKIHSGDIFFVDAPKVIGSGQEKTMKGIWLGRPGVVISNDGLNSGRGGDVFMVFLTNRAHELESWYKQFSPRQVDVQRDDGNFSTALCSQVVLVEKEDLGSWMGTVTEEELLHITNEVREYMDEYCCGLLYPARSAGGRPADLRLCSQESPKQEIEV